MTEEKPADADKKLWKAVEEHLVEALSADPPALRKVREASRKAELPAMEISPLQAQFLAMLIRISRAKRVLEVGTLGGYSTIAMAGALPEGGTIHTIEQHDHIAKAARANIEEAGLTDKITVSTGKATEILPKLDGPFDFIFLDADKRTVAKYLEQCLALSKAGTLMVIDNLVRRGKLLDTDSTDSSDKGIQQMLDFVRNEPRLTAAALQTVGASGHDGMLFLHVVK